MLTAYTALAQASGRRADTLGDSCPVNGAIRPVVGYCYDLQLYSPLLYIIIRDRPRSPLLLVPYGSQSKTHGVFTTIVDVFFRGGSTKPIYFE